MRMAHCGMRIAHSGAGVRNAGLVIADCGFASWSWTRCAARRHNVAQAFRPAGCSMMAAYVISRLDFCTIETQLVTDLCRQRTLAGGERLFLGHRRGADGFVESPGRRV